jgi:hypothetical protein
MLMLRVSLSIQMKRREPMDMFFAGAIVEVIEIGSAFEHREGIVKWVRDTGEILVLLPKKPRHVGTHLRDPVPFKPSSLRPVSQSEFDGERKEASVSAAA